MKDRPTQKSDQRKSQDAIESPVEAAEQSVEKEGVHKDMERPGELDVSGRRMIMTAKSTGDAIKAFQLVKVLEVVGGDILVVEPEK